jgi:hypothetical protein
MTERDACVCGCTEPVHNGAKVGIEEPGVCMCGHYLYLHYRDELEVDRD